MAKNVGLIGSLRGKIGNTVFYVNQGIQVARVYQPVVSNPNTPLQIQQRAKMSLAGQLSSVTPAAALMGLKGENKRDRRGEFVRLVVKSATYANNKASLADNALVLSEGRQTFLCSHTATSTTSGGRLVQITISTTPVGAAPSASYAERYVIYLINPTTSKVDFCRTGLLTMPTGSSAAATQVNIYVNPNTAADYVPKVYVIPMSTSLNPSVITYSFVGSEEGNFILVDGRLTSEVLTYGNSVNVALASQSKDDDPNEKTKKK